jgi:hypothetical protein
VLRVAPWLGLHAALVTAALLAPVTTTAALASHSERRTTATFGVSQYAPQLPHSGPISSVAQHPFVERIVLATSETGGLFRSENHGDDWRRQRRVSSTRMQDVEYLRVGSSFLGSPRYHCLCVIATGAAEYEVTGGGGVWLATGPPNEEEWAPLRGVFPASSTTRCDVTTAGAYGISIAADTRKTYVATDCGLVELDDQLRVTRLPIDEAPSDALRDVVALGGGKLIAGGPSIGVWRSSDHGETWQQSSTTAVGAISDIHAFGSDPRGGDRAYVINDGTELYQTTTAGDTWSRVAGPAGGRGCGGIAHVEARLATSPVQGMIIYFGNRCDTRATFLQLGQEPSAVIDSDSDWATLRYDHTDTRDVDFFGDSPVPRWVTSDGGIERHRPSESRYRYVGGVGRGLNADQVTEVAAQYVPGRTEPDLYFATWHNKIWGMRGTVAQGDQIWEGFGLGVWPRITDVDSARITFTYCGPCNNLVARVGLANKVGWTSARANAGSPTMVRYNRWVQAVPAEGTSPAGLAYTTAFDTNTNTPTWRQMANISQPLWGWPQVTGDRSNPTLIQPYYSGDRPRTTPATAVVKLIRLENWADGTDADVSWPEMNQFGELGVNSTNMAWYEVLAVDPTDPSRMIAPDVRNGDIRRTTTGGLQWEEIPGLARQVTREGRYRFSVRANNRLAPNASVVSICPYNNSRVLIGTRQGGAHFSYDGGATWRYVTESEPIVWATTIEWLEGCGSAYMSTYGRGIWRINMGVRTETIFPTHPCVGPICHLRDLAKHYLALIERRPGPPPSLDSGLLVSDGSIVRIVQLKAGKTRAELTPGAVYSFYRAKPAGLTVKHLTRTPSGKRLSHAAFFRNGRLVASVSERRTPRLFPLRRGKVGKGLRRAPVAQLARLQIKNEGSAFGNAQAVIEPHERLELSFHVLKKYAGTIELQIDGHTVAKYAPDTAVHSYKANEPFEEPGPHTISLIVREAKLRRLASTLLWVMHAEEHERRPNG